MSSSSYGWQRQGEDDYLCLPPFSPQSPFFGSPGPSAQELEWDLQAPTQIPGPAIDQLLSPNTTFPFQWPATNLNDILYSSAEQPYPPIIETPFQPVRDAKRRNRGSYRRIGNRSVHVVQQQVRSPQVDWRENNIYAPLHPDWTPPSSDERPNQQYLGQNEVSAGDGHLSPPVTGHRHSQESAARPSDTMQRQSPHWRRGPNEPTLTLNNIKTFQNTGRLGPQQYPTPVDVNEWRRSLYLPGKRPIEDETLPPSPSPSRPHQREGSIAPSVSSQALACDFCGKSFEKKYDLGRHRRNHGPRPHVCSNCGSAFVFAKDLRRHNRSQAHSVQDTTQGGQDRQFYCPVAGCEWNIKGFARKDQQKRHVGTQHFPPTPATTRSKRSDQLRRE